VGSFIFTFAAVFIYLYFVFPAVFYSGKYWLCFLLTISAVVIGTLGDIAESLIKRDAGVKDMSNLIPGHGGLLDRVDALILSAPFIYAVLSTYL
jgi:phosphatidate cytidylyltransferase